MAKLIKVEYKISTSKRLVAKEHYDDGSSKIVMVRNGIVDYIMNKGD